MPGLAEMIQSPRLYSLAGLPEGPSWEQVRQLIANLNTEQESHIRTRAVVLLLAVYGLRIGEVCGLSLDDIDWVNEKIRVRRFKSKRVQEFPLAFEVGNAILKYIQKVRPHSNSRSLFLSLHRPFRPMTRPGASGIVSRLVKSLDGRQHYRGAHSLRHACATHLLSEGFSLKEIGDQLGHRSPRTTRIYTKVELGKLALVPDVDVSRLKEFLRSQTCTPTAAWAAERASVLREVSDFKLGGLR
jgi:integrase